MNKYLVVLAAAMLVACGGKDKDGTDTSVAGDDDDDSCVDILEFFPADGDGAVYYRTAIEFTMEETDGSESITVDGLDGSSAVVDNKVVFTPTGNLDPSTSYTVTLDWACGPTSTTWTTSAVGAAANEDDLIGSTYALDLATGRFVYPAGIGPLIQQELEQPILMGVTDITGSDLQMMGALGTTGTPPAQDMCAPSIDFPVAADFSENPYFVIGPEQITLDIEGIEIEIEDMIISGAFAPDGSYVAGATLAGAIDTRPLAGLLGATGDDDAICDLVVTFGVACEACPDQTDYCLSVFVDNMVGDSVPGSLVEVVQDDIDNNGDCTE